MGAWSENRSATDAEVASVRALKKIPRKHVDFEDLLELSGGFGKFQVGILVAILISEIPAAFVAFAPIFIIQKPTAWTCTTVDNVSSVLQPEDGICNCNGTLTASNPELSIITEVNKKAEKGRILGDFITSMQMLGMLIGSIATSQLSDWYGRKKTYLCVCALMAFGQCASAMSPSPILYAFSRFISGAGLSGFMGVSTVYPMEFLTPKWRSLCGSVGPWGEGIMLLALLAAFIGPWRQLLWVSSIPFIVVFISYPFLPESPRWLLRNRRTDEALLVLQQMANVNTKRKSGEKRSPFLVDRSVLEAVCQQECEGVSKCRFTYLDFFREKKLRWKTLCLMGIWFAWSLVYYGISYNINNLKGNLYVNVVLLGAVDAISYPFALLINDRLGRRLSLVVFMSIGTFFLVSLAIVDITMVSSMYHAKIVVALCFLGKFGVAAARSSARCLTSESFPTPIRTMGYGISGITAGFGGILAPQLAFLGSAWWHPLPYLAFAGVALGGSAISLLLQETNGMALTETVTEDRSPASKSTVDYGTVAKA